MSAFLTPEVLAFFDELAKDAPNWSGVPLFDGDATQKGYLVNLKKAGLVTTEVDDDPGRMDLSTGRRLPPSVFVSFTPAGVKLAIERGFPSIQTYY